MVLVVRLIVFVKLAEKKIRHSYYAVVSHPTDNHVVVTA